MGILPEQHAKAAALDGVTEAGSTDEAAARYAAKADDRLAASLGSESAIVSFNWDVLLEVALRRAGRGFEYVPSGPRRDATALLKPHGSINWFALLDRELLSVDLRANIVVLGGDLSSWAATGQHATEISTCVPETHRQLTRSEEQPVDRDSLPSEPRGRTRSRTRQSAAAQ